MLSFDQFKQSLTAPKPPEGLSVLLQALWYDGREEWHTAHDLIDDLEGRDAAWVHAYLHRKEGDAGNANYWYARAKKVMPLLSLEEEWEYISRQLLDEPMMA